MLEMSGSLVHLGETRIHFPISGIDRCEIIAQHKGRVGPSSQPASNIGVGRSEVIDPKFPRFTVRGVRRYDPKTNLIRSVDIGGSDLLTIPSGTIQGDLHRSPSVQTTEGRRIQLYVVLIIILLIVSDTNEKDLPRL